MFARKIRSVFGTILPSTTKTTATRENLSTRFYKPGYKILFLNYRTGKSFWEEGIIMKRIGHMLYSVRSSKFDCRRHINQLRPRHTDDYKQAEDNELPLEVLYDFFLMFLYPWYNLLREWFSYSRSESTSFTTNSTPSSGVGEKKYKGEKKS